VTYKVRRVLLRVARSNDLQAFGLSLLALAARVYAFSCQRLRRERVELRPDRRLCPVGAYAADRGFI
jgi:hypothetical protein